jgi:long-chain acyl-CoA synthetase
MEGYGLTETSPVIAVNRFNEKERMFGSVGPLINGVEVKIAEDGEILCKGPNVMMGYYKRPDLTAENIINEWFYTGDIGMLVNVNGTKSSYANGSIEDPDEKNKLFLKITDRKKELFKTSGGKYVAPLPIENKLKESMVVDQVMVVGSERKFVGALIVPNFPNLKKWSLQNGIPFTTKDQVIKNEKVIEMYKELVESFNKNFNHVEQIKKFELLPNEWSVDTGELSPKLNLKRKVVMEKYRDSIERIYR